MKKTSITISYDEEKLSALKLYLGQKNSSAENELTKALDMLYAKTVPAGVREFIDLRSGKAPISNTPGKSLYVSGQVVGIYGAAQGVLVLGSGPVETVDGSSRQPAEHIVFPGDYITAVNGKAVTKKEELMERINQYGEQPVVLTLWRGAEQIQVSVEPVEAAEHKGYRLGLWVKDDMAGIGTLTYFDQDGNFGALGHGIGNGQTKDLLRLSDGRLYKAQVLGIKKGVRGTPGELEGVVYYGKDNQIGEVSSNTQIGIYGTLTKNFREEKKNESLLCPVGYKQEIQTKDAVILSDASG